MAVGEASDELLRRETRARVTQWPSRDRSARAIQAMPSSFIFFLQ
jgi:hypothetical protein